MRTPVYLPTENKTETRLKQSTAHFMLWRAVSICSVLSPKMNTLSRCTCSEISTLAPSSVPMMMPPFMMNFMLDVPLASMPAVEMC